MTYNQLLSNIKKLQELGLQCGSIGNTVLGRQIPYIKIGDGDNNIILQAAIHAREYATCALALMQAKYLSRQNIEGFSIYIVPMLNPDGVEISINGLDSVKSTYIKDKLFIVNGSLDFVDFKANANCVDLNTNFDARWGHGKSNINFPSIQNFVGYFPHDQVETRAIVSLTNYLKPKATLSYHSRGREIYWDFFASPKNIARDLAIAEKLASNIRYTLSSSQESSAGGYKDWCIQQFGIPSFTIEFFDSKAEYPISREMIVEEFERTKDIVKSLLEYLK